jgi:endonuclease/exonuclease/phosphatase family metal-dependent hydrolase
MNDDRISVLTLNLRFGLADNGSNSWQYRKRSFQPLFKKYRPDFIALQEANNFQIDDLSQILTEYTFIGKRTPAPSFWQNNIIFYKKNWRRICHEHFFLSPTPDIPSRSRKSRWPRQCTIGMFSKNNRAIICVNTHFDFDVAVQIESAGLIMERLSNQPSDRPIVLTGDFNAPPTSPGHMIFTGQHQKFLVKEPYFKNAFKAPFPGTYHGFTGRPDGDHIDWILYRGRIVPEDCGVIQDTFGGIYPSDHFPLYAQFSSRIT